MYSTIYLPVPHPGLGGAMQPPSQPVAPIPQPMHSPFQSPTSLSSSMSLGMKVTPDMIQSNETQRSTSPNLSLPSEKPSSPSPPPATASSHSPKVLNPPGIASLTSSSSSVGISKPAFTSAPSSLFFPHLAPAASFAAASSTAAFYSGLRNLQQFQQQQQAAAAAAAALQATVSQSGPTSSTLGSINSNSDVPFNGVSPPLLGAMPSLRLPTSSSFVPISMSPKGGANIRISDLSDVNGAAGGASPPRISPRSGSAFSVESTS